MKNFLKYAILTGLFITPFIAFIISNTMLFPFITGKGFTFRILVEIIFGLYVILAFLEPKYRPKISWITKSAGIFIIVMFIADLFSANVSKSFWSNYERMEGFVLLIHLFAYYIVASSVLLTDSLWKKLFNTSIIASVLMSIYGLFQLTGYIKIDQGTDRIDGTFGNASYFAIYLVFHIFFSIWLLLGEKEIWKKWMYGAAIVFESAMLYYTATRGAILGLIGGLFLAALLFVWKEKQQYIKLKKAASYFLGIIVVLVVGFLLIRNTSFVQKNPILTRFASIGPGELTTQGRYYVWPMAIKGFAENPKTFLIGWGQESFNFVFNKYYNPKMYGMEEWFDRAHDIVLDWLVAGGLVGLLAYASMYAALIYYIWRKQSPLALWEKSLFIGLIAGYIFNNIFVFDNLVSYILFFSVLAYIHVRSDDGRQMEFKTPSRETINYIVTPIVLLLTVLIIYFVNVPAILANETLIQAMGPNPQGLEGNLSLFKQAYSYNSFGNDEITEQLVQIAVQVAAAPANQGDSQSKLDFINLAAQKIQEKTKNTPNDARYFVLGGSFFDRIGQYDLALQYLNRALALSPEKESIYFELGSAYLNKGDTATAFQTFQKAYNLDPQATEAKVIYLLGAIYTRNVSVINSILPQIDPSVVLSDDRIISAYASVGNYKAVIDILNARIAKDPTNLQNRLSLAYAYAAEGDKQTAIGIVQQMINQNPSFKTQGQQYIQQIESK